jgi:aryl-alcohol dehydrogenase-like predicted oxidoreductase
MEQRRLGRTEHRSSVAILGCCAFADGDSEKAAVAVRDAVTRGVNHFDVAPSYGQAEAALGPVMPEVRDRIFLACKTMERSAEGARRELEASLERLQVDSFDLYQLHAVTSDAELDTALAPGGAIDTLLAARDEGLTRFVGITGHFLEAPRVFRRAIDEAPFDTVLFPLNAGHLSDPDYRAAAEALLERCAELDVGAMAIKAMARRRWPSEEHSYRTWYEPFEQTEDIERAVAFTLSFPVAGFATPCDARLLPLALDAAERVIPMTESQREEYLASKPGAPLASMASGPPV